MRKDIEEKLQISEKTLRNILNEMQEYGLVLQHKQPIEPRLAPSSIQIFFPHLFI
jgi:DNA-binding HxlR family transcriptional regulator